MEKVKIIDKVFRKSISHERICLICDEIAEKITRDYEATSTDEDPLVLCIILNGALPFASQLLKRLNFPVRIVCTKLTSYRGTESSGEVEQTLPFTNSIEGAKVIVVEDVVDTGKSIIKIKELTEQAGAREVKYCTMLLKPDKYPGDVPLDYVGLEIPNEFIVGFGLDYEELGRNLNDIYTLDVPEK